MKKIYFSTLFLLLVLLFSCGGHSKLYVVTFNNPEGLHQFFAYSGKNTPIISGHRGMHISGYPENAIETFEQVLQHTPAFFEIDPRLTKDSVIVLLHDATLDRTTTGKGKLSDYTWEEVQKFYLKDKEGNTTRYRIPTLQQAIEWAKGKTILNLDKKDVPLQMTADIIRKNKAGSYVMVTVHTAAQAKFYYDDDPLRMMSAFVKTEEAMKAYEAAGVPWKNIIAYIGSENKPENRLLYDLLHARGVMCMISAAPVYDKLSDTERRATAYRDIFTQGADILESDYPIEVAAAINDRKAVRSKK